MAMAMVGMANTGRSSKLLYCLLVFASSPAGAGDWNITPVLSVREYYSDNITLSSANPEASFLTELTPGIKISRKGARGNLSVDYALQGQFYSHDSNVGGYNNQLTAALQSELIDDSFFVDAKANIGQQNNNLTNAVGVDNTSASGNKSEVRSASVTPSWRARFGADANLDARWQLTYSDSDSGVVSGVTGNALSIALRSGAAFKRVPWNLSYRLSNNNGSASASRISSVSVGLGYVFSPKLRTTFTLGKDSNNGSTQGFNQTSGNYWNAGVDWTPSPRTSLDVNLGHRYNGNSYGLNFTHRTRRTTWAVMYSEDVSDTYNQVNGSEAFDIYRCGNYDVIVAAGSPSPDPVLCGTAPLYPALRRNSTQLVNDTTLNKTWSGSVTYQAGKSTFRATYNKSSRQLLSVGGSDDNYSLVGSWSLKLGPRTTSTISLTSSHAKTLTSQSDDWIAHWVVSRQLTKKATAALELRRQERDAGSTSGGYKENSVSARINMSF